MKKVLLTTILITLLITPCYAAKEDVPEVKLQSIFLTDTKDVEDYIEPEDIPLKGYAQYIEDSQAIYLTDDNNQFVLNLKVPQKITTPTLQDKHEGIFAKRPVQYSKYEAEEFQIIPKEGSGIVTQGPISFGTNMTRDVDYGQLEHVATFFSRYDKGRFSVNTAYERTIGSTYNNYYDNLYIAPELKLNKFMAIRNTLTADITRDRKKNEVVLSVKPLAQKQGDRLNLEFGASQTYDSTNALIRRQIKFNTKFKL